jgi:thiazole synthase
MQNDEATAVMIDSSISSSQNLALMSEAFKDAINSGRKVFLKKFRAASDRAKNSSPLTDFLN